MKIKHVFGNVLRIDIPLTIKIRTIEEGTPSEMEEPFYPDATKRCIVELANNYNRKIEYEATIKDNIVHIEDNGKISIGRYKITVKCYDADGNPYRYMARDIIDIVDATADAGIEAGIEFASETYTLEGAYFIKGEKGEKGDKGDKGDDGITPHVDDTTGNWFVGDEDTGVHAQGERGEQGEQGEKGDTGFCFFAIFEVDSNGDLWMTHNPLDEVVLEVDDGYLYQTYNI